MNDLKPSDLLDLDALLSDEERHARVLHLALGEAVEPAVLVGAGGADLARAAAGPERAR